MNHVFLKRELQQSASRRSRRASQTRREMTLAYARRNWVECKYFHFRDSKSYGLVVDWANVAIDKLEICKEEK